MEFPKKFDKCPLCGCKERVVESIVEEEKKKGKMNKKATFGTNIPQALALVDPTRTQLSVIAVLTLKDICGKCGFEYPICVMKHIMPWPPQGLNLEAAIKAAQQQQGSAGPR